VRVINLPAYDPRPPDLDVYHKMMEGISNEKLTVPVVLHCLIEQVRVKVS
jgi:hypothetical protein